MRRAQSCYGSHVVMLVDYWGPEKTVAKGWEVVRCREDSGAKTAMRGHVPGSKTEKENMGMREIHTRDGLIVPPERFTNND